MDIQVLRSAVLPRLVMRHWIGIFFTVIALAVVARHLMVLASGRGYWTIGDWLINFQGGYVRRGMTGEFTLMLSDLTGIRPDWWAGFQQIAFYLAVVGLVLYLFSQIRPTGPVLMLLFSPVFLLMPFYYMHMSMSKELIGFFALGLMAAGVMTGWRTVFWFGIALLALGGQAHEVNAFLAPVALAFPALWFWSGGFSRREAVIAALALAVPAAVNLGLAALYPGHGLSAAICEALTTRGVNADHCDRGGPIGWLERDMAFGISVMAKMTIQPGNWLWYICAYAAALVPFALFRVPGKTRLTALLLAAAVIGILSMAPLFLVATDWGRWIAMYVFALTLLVITALRLGKLEPRLASVGPLFLAYGLLWSMPEAGYTHTTWGMIGIAGTMVKEAAGLVGF